MNSIKLLFVTTLLFSLSANAQLDKKMWLVGGSGSFDSYNSEYTFLPSSSDPYITTNYHFIKIEISAYIGYFVIDKLVMGLKPEGIYSKGYSEANGYLVDPTKLIIGPFARYYLLNKEKPFNVFVESNYQTGINKFYTIKSVNYSGKGNYTKLAIMAGTEIFFNSSIGIEMQVGYKATKETMNKPSTPYTDIRNGFQVGVGFKIHLEKS